MTATREERRALLAVRCPWCEAPPKQFCRSRRVRLREWSGAPQVLTDLPGYSHEARWIEAGLLTVPVPV